jgi:hypothetical protein
VRLHVEHLPASSGRAVGDGAGITCVASTVACAQEEEEEEEEGHGDGAPPPPPPPPPPQQQQQQLPLGASASGERGVRAEDMGAACGRALARQLCSGAGADEWLADQLVVMMALARGRSRVLCAAPLTLHARTAIAVAEQLTAGARARAAAAAGGAGGRGPAPAAALFRLTPVEGSRERAAEAARRAGFAFAPGEPGSEGLVLLECEGVGAAAGATTG